jgi:type I restriction enzyme, S subunit
MIENLNMPKHWQIARIGEYVISVKGKKPKKISSVKTHEFPLPYVNIKAFEKNIIDEFTDGVGCVLCEEDDFLMVWDGSRSGYVGKAIKGALGSTLVKLKFPNIDTNYAYYFLQSKYIELNTRAKGVGIPHVDPNILWNYNFPIPPIKEQKSIVSKIEDLLSDLENGNQQLLLAQQQLKVYRQSLLKWAFEGKLTINKGKWERVSLSMVANAIDPQPSHRTPSVVSRGIPFISIKDFDSETDKINFLSARKVSLDVLKQHLERYKLECGDFVIGKIGTIGKPVRVVLPQNYTLSANIVLIQPRKINATYLYFFFQSNLIEKAFTAGMKATTQSAFGIQKVRDLKIELPTKDEQELIVEVLESRISICNEIEKNLSKCLLQVETLKQSILKKAFEGRLI